MMLFWPAPPRRVPPADAPFCTTPGASDVRLVKLRVRDRQVLDLRRRDGERPLAALRLDERRFGGDVDGFRGAADLDGQLPSADAVAAADLDAGPPQRLEPVHRHFDGVGVRRHVREDVVAGFVGDDGRRISCLSFR